MDESLTFREWRAAVELPMNDEILLPEWIWGRPSMYIPGDDGVPGVKLLSVCPWINSWKGFITEHDTFGFLEQEAVSEMPQPKGPFRRIISDEATDPMGDNYGAYAMDNDNYGALAIWPIRLLFEDALRKRLETALLKNLIRERGSKPLLLAMEEARTVTRNAYHLYSRLIKERLNMSFTSPWFRLPSWKARDHSARPTNGVKFFEGDDELILTEGKKDGVDDNILGNSMKQFRSHNYLDLQTVFFARNLSENTFGSLNGMAPDSGIFPWIHKVVNGPEHRSTVPDKGDGVGAGIEEENCRNAGTWLVATAAPHHATGNRELLTGFTPDEDFFLQAGDGTPMEVRGRGTVVTDAVVLPDVWFVPGLTANLVSAGQLAELGYSIGFARGACRIVGGGGGVAGEARVGEDGMFELQFLKLPLAM